MLYFPFSETTPQRDSGILRRSVASVLGQQLPPGISLQLVIVDDGSPVPTEGELAGINPPSGFAITVITQDNAGVAAARNRGLDHLAGKVAFIAFLDSDDVWHPGHLEQGIGALERGGDFYFCDNTRPGHHESHFRASTRLIVPFIEATSEDVVWLSPAQMTWLLLREFPSQASTTVFRSELAREVRFDASLRASGEDMLFFMQLVERSGKVCFSPRIMVTCDEGINIYFGAIGWDSPSHLRLKVDRLRAHYIMGQRLNLSTEDRLWNDRFIATLRRNIVFHTIRVVVRDRGEVPEAVRLLAAEDKQFWRWFLLYLAQVSIGRVLRVYQPT